MYGATNTLILKSQLTQNFSNLSWFNNQSDQMVFLLDYSSEHNRQTGFEIKWFKWLRPHKNLRLRSLDELYYDTFATREQINISSFYFLNFKIFCSDRGQVNILKSCRKSKDAGILIFEEPTKKKRMLTYINKRTVLFEKVEMYLFTLMSLIFYQFA